MPTPCNIRYKHLKQLEAEFALAQQGGDDARLMDLAREIQSLGAEFNSRHAESERLLANHGSAPSDPVADVRRSK